MSFYLEIECDKYKPHSCMGNLILLRDTPTIPAFDYCKQIVMEAQRKFVSKKRNVKRNTKIKYLRVVNKYHETVFEIKMDQKGR